MTYHESSRVLSPSQSHALWQVTQNIAFPRCRPKDLQGRGWESNPVPSHSNKRWVGRLGFPVMTRIPQGLDMTPTQSYGNMPIFGLGPSSIDKTRPLDSEKLRVFKSTKQKHPKSQKLTTSVCKKGRGIFEKTLESEQVVFLWNTLGETTPPPQKKKEKNKKLDWSWEYYLVTIINISENIDQELVVQLCSTILNEKK